MTRRAKVLVTVVCALVAAFSIALAPAIAEQASQPTAPVAGWLDSGRYHTCAVVPPGDVRCWGYGAYGSLGYGNRQSIGDDETPADGGTVEIGADRTVTAVSAGKLHNCAV